MKDLVIGKPHMLSRKLFNSRVEEIFDKGVWSNNGKYVKAVEGFYRNTHSVVTANATVALELAITAIFGTWPKKAIVIPTYTFVATATAVIRAGHVPIFVDVKDNYTLNLEKAEEEATFSKIDGILPVHLFGNLADIDHLEEMKTEYKILYDAAHANGMFYNGKELGEYGEGAVYSFHPTKLAGGLELGVFSTVNKDLAEKVRRMRNFGLDPATAYDIDMIEVGTNAKANEVSAAAALTQMEDMDLILTKYALNYSAYMSMLPEGFTLNPLPWSSNHSYVVVQTELDTYALIERLKEKGIFARKYFKPLHQIVVLNRYDHAIGDYPVAERLYDRSLCLPTGLDIDESDIYRVCEELKRAA